MTALSLGRIESIFQVAELEGVVPETVNYHFGDLAQLVAAVDTARRLPGGPGVQINTYLAEHYTAPTRRARIPADRVGHRRAVLLAAMKMIPPEPGDVLLREFVAWEQSVPSVTAIARSAGVSAALVADNFGSKVDLVQAVACARTLPGSVGEQVDTYLADHYVPPVPGVRAPGEVAPKDRPKDHLGRYVNAECAVCGAPFYDNGHQDVCSRACSVTRGKADRRWRKPGPRCKFPSCDKLVTATCEVCGGLFHRHMWRGRWASTCSRACYWETYRPSATTREDREWNHFRSRGEWPSTPIRWLGCAWCGETFLSRYGMLTCSDRCKRRRASRISSDSIMERYRSDPEFRADMIRKALNRYAGKLGLEGITQPRDLTLYLLERDGNVCGICGGTVIDEGGPRQPSVDHIIPLAKGGAHGPGDGNLQLAHLDCNLRKNDKVIPSVLGYPGEYAAAS